MTLPEQPEQPAARQSAAEEALERLDDRIGAFTAYTLAADFLELREILAGNFQRISVDDWSRRTERRPGAWTVRQTLAHVAAVAETFNTAIAASLEERSFAIDGFASRHDLKAANIAALAARTALSPDELVRSFLASLDEAARVAATLEPKQLGRPAPVPFYDGVPTVAELFGCSLAHAGIVHGAQLAAVRSRPIWIFFGPGLMRRQITRFVHNLGLSYWPERGGDLHATIAFKIEGQGGGSWTVRADPAGGEGRIGVARTNDVSLRFASADLFCRLFTFKARPWRALLTRQLRVSGNIRLAMGLSRLFTPT